MSKTEHTPLWPGGPLFSAPERAPLSTDSVLLADFVPLAGARRGIDLGCASGAIALILLARAPSLEMSGLEIDPEAADLARELLEINGFAARGRIVCGDLRRTRELFPPGAFDLAVSNPPYFPSGSGALPPDEGRAAARSEERGFTLEQLCVAAAWLLRSGGRFCLVQRCTELSRVLCAMSAAHIEPKRLRLVSARAESAPRLALIEGRRNGRPGLSVEPPLLLCGPDGEPTPEYRRIYRMGEP